MPDHYMFTHTHTHTHTRTHTHTHTHTQGLDADQKARVNEVLQSAKGQGGDMQDEDDDDCRSVASQPVGPTQRSPSPRVFRRGSGHFVSKPVCAHSYM